MAQQFRRLALAALLAAGLAWQAAAQSPTPTGDNLSLASPPSLEPCGWVGVGPVMGNFAAAPDGARVIGGNARGDLEVFDTTATGYAGSETLSERRCAIALAFSPDGRRLAISDADGLRILDADDGRPLGERFGDAARSLAYSPDGGRIAAASGKLVQVWDAASGKPAGPPLAALEDEVTFVAFSPDGRRIAGAAGARIWIWDLATGRLDGQPLEGHADAVNALAFTPDGRRLVSGSDDATLRIWDLATHRLVRPPIRNRYPYRRDPQRTVESGVLWVAVSPDGRRIASGSRDQTARIWDAASGDPVGLPLVGPDEAVGYVAFSPNGRFLMGAAAHYEELPAVWVWDIEASALRRFNGLPEGAEWAKCLLVVDGERRIFGRCAYLPEDDGGFEIEGPRQIYGGIDYPVANCGCTERSRDYWARVFPDGDGWQGYANADVRATHGDNSFETLKKTGDCFIGERVRLCVWRRRP